jgi:putative heme transporter
MSELAVSSERRKRTVLVFGFATAVYLGWLVVAHRAEIDRAVLRFPGAKTRWLVGAVALEGVSQTCLTLLQRHLLQRAGTPITVRSAFRLVLAQNAIGLAVPGGPVVASVFSYRQIRRRGTNAPAAAWVVAATNIAGMLAVATFGIFTAPGFSAWSLLSGLAFTCAMAVLIVSARSPERLRPLGVAMMQFFDRVLSRHPETSADERMGARIASLESVHLRWFDWVIVGALALGAVAADCAVFVFASRAIVSLPARCLRGGLSARAAATCARFKAPTLAGLFVAYSAGQVGLLVPFLPGGIGLVESIMTATLRAGRVSAIPALSSVLLYRLVSFWSIVVVGGVMWATFRRKRDRIGA